MLCDFHLHTEISSDCSTPVNDQIDRAISLDMKEICITDHHDYDTQGPGCGFMLDPDEYMRALEAARQEYEGTIVVNRGIELGLQNHVADALNDIADDYPFDFIIGSSHFVDGYDPYYPEYFEGKTEREAYEHYFEVTLERVKRLSCFDVLGHLDYVVRYGPNQNRYYSYEAYRDSIDPILKTLIEKGKGLECNTGGLKYGLGHPNPTEDVLKRYRELGGEIITVGSDAHVPGNIGYAFDIIPDMLKDCGFKYYTVFHERKPVFLPL